MEQGKKRTSKPSHGKQPKRMRYVADHRGERHRLEDLRDHAEKNPLDLQAKEALKRLEQGFGGKHV